jgi:hypothetical protein
MSGAIPLLSLYAFMAWTGILYGYILQIIQHSPNESWDRSFHCVYSVTMTKQSTISQSKLDTSVSRMQEEKQ